MSEWRRRYLGFRIWLGLTFFKQPCYLDEFQRSRRRPLIINLGFGQYLKRRSSANEVEALRYVRLHTNIPVPHVYGAWLRNGDYYNPRANMITCCVVMSRIPGIPLQEVRQNISTTDLNDVLLCLRTYVEQLRQVRQPSLYRRQICSFIGQEMDDPGLTLFETVDPLTPTAFVDYMLAVPVERRRAEHLHSEAILSKHYEGGLVLTHGDLHPSNIIVSKSWLTGSYFITGIIDWSTAGWYPIYWEAFKARSYGYEVRWWRQYIPLFAGQYQEEVEVLRELHSKSVR